MESPVLSVSDALAGKRILLTGSTGFLGKVTLSMLLHRYGEVLGRVWALVRRGSSTSAEARFVEKVVRSEPLQPLRDHHGDERAEAFVLERCRVLDGDRLRLGPDGIPVMRLMFFPAASCEILDTWHSIGLRGTGSHDYTATDLFVPAARSLSFREPPAAPGPLYALPTIALFGTVLAAVPLGIARHAIDILTELAGTKITTRTQQVLREDATMRGDLGRAEALLRSGRAFLYEALEEAWRVVSAGQTISVTQRALVWLASTHAANAAKQATELMFSAGGATSAYVSNGLERCLRDVHAAGQHLTLASSNYEMAGQAFLGSDMRTTPLLVRDDRSAG